MTSSLSLVWVGKSCGAAIFATLQLFFIFAMLNVERMQSDRALPRLPIMYNR